MRSLQHRGACRSFSHYTQRGKPGRVIRRGSGVLAELLIRAERRRRTALLLLGDDDHVNYWKYCLDMKVQAGHPPEYQVVVYPGATHSFDRSRPRRIVFGDVLFYDPKATEDAYRRVREFLDKYLY